MTAPARKKATSGQLAAGERLHTLGQLVAGVVHELNNPLTIVSANLQMLQEYVSQQEALLERYEQLHPTHPTIEAFKGELDYDYLALDLPRLLQSCQDGATRAVRLVDELRRYAGSAHVEWAPVDLKECLGSTVRLVESSYRNRIQFQLEWATLPLIIGVGGQLQQVFMNLLINACQAIQGKGSVKIHATSNQESVILTLRDTGPGIGPDVLPRIFEPYFTTKSPAEGTGLGLPITKRIIENHGGSLVVESTLGQGTTFVITLPTIGPTGLFETQAPYEF
jgi:two-component system NtrC family sensor kinase